VTGLEASLRTTITLGGNNKHSTQARTVPLFVRLRGSSLCLVYTRLKHPFGVSGTIDSEPYMVVLGTVTGRHVAV
jgi:hypothetical protein